MVEDKLDPNKKKGDALESAVEHILNIGGFKTERNVFIRSYEIDVKAVLGDRILIFECKNYQNSSLTVRNLIHQWYSKNEILKAHKIILVLAGIPVSVEDRNLASELDMEIWSDDDFTELFQLSLKPDELRERLLEKISLEPITISEMYRDDIIYFIVKKKLERQSIYNTEVFERLNKWLRSYIITQLMIKNSDKELRQQHIELFEGIKKKEVKRFFIKSTQKRSAEEYWNAIKNRLSNQNIFGKSIQNEYLFYMKDLIKEYNLQVNFFNGETSEPENRLMSIILVWIHFASLNRETCEFSMRQSDNTYSQYSVHVVFIEDYFELKINSITENQANILNWILVSKYSKEQESYSWYCNSIKETAEKVYRIFDEFVHVEIENFDSIKDKKLTVF